MFITLKHVGKTNEDADPPLAFHPMNNTAFSIIGTFDGLGGSGGATKHTINGKQRSTAYVGSRLTASILKAYLADHAEKIFKMTNEEISAELTKHLFSQLRAFDEKHNLHNDLGRVRGGTLRKLLATTVAVNICKEKEDTVEVISLWAGDSRCYVLLPETGLSQLSKDDIAGPDVDAMENNIADASMSNVVHLPIISSNSPQFVIHAVRHTFPKPCIVFTATDGCFQYPTTELRFFGSPMHLEKIILETIIDCNEKKVSDDKIGLELFSHLKLSRFEEGSGYDDATLSAAVFADGNSPLSSLYASFKKRFDELNYILAGAGDSKLEKAVADYSKMRIRGDELHAYIEQQIHTCVIEELKKAFSNVKVKCGQPGSENTFLISVLSRSACIANLPESFYASNSVELFNAVRNYVYSVIRSNPESLPKEYKEYETLNDDTFKDATPENNLVKAEAEMLRSIWYNGYKEGYEKYISGR